MNNYTGSKQSVSEVQVIFLSNPHPIEQQTSVSSSSLEQRRIFFFSQCDLADSKLVVAKQPSLSHWRSFPPMDPVQQLTLTGEVCSDARHIST
mmetsp:Transcript_5854/g.8300  ORF Transcript_5854/g.8300 Transcript_5854/m.8300 type:complete len:93 (+) Transcript_5854:999-1277(+)